ncbi:hypothetical protein ACFSPU_02200 [Haoranjiania flava]|uniref:Uncharacterized protein n=1 Tax=Haoranjiania flava TaxID=1856322 RepID=A0AAE3LIX4_9BACT|nr:hypothetical protein [Haoranjiania flava]MCU7693043.1 hypothetical protein [Haoranjiania flava]
MKIILLCSLALLLSAGSCKKSAQNQLPPATQTGANTFGCKINGVVYKCRGLWDPRGIFQTDGIYFQYSEDKMYLKEHFSAPEKTIIAMRFEYDGKTGIYKEFITRSFETVSQNSYVKVTRFDDLVFSGEFTFIVTFDDGTVKTITDGRFDIKKPN